ncbi:MAG TPA: type VI secretion system tube protein Hcp [Thermoanaerobaculia bacterium]|nr:type VI secretion system tube protein Hcp [Thermoanaerobaculia bacterium]
MAFDSFLKLDNIEGESMDSKHKNEIEVLSFGIAATAPGDKEHGPVGVTNPASQDTGGGGGSTVSQHGDLMVTKVVDKSTPKLFEACAAGIHIPKAVLTFRKAGKDQQDFFVRTFSDVFISSIQYGQGADKFGTNLPVEQVQFNYGKAEIEYKEQKSDGTLGGSTKAGWNVKARKKT